MIQNAEQVANNSNIQYTYASRTAPTVRKFDGAEQTSSPFPTPTDQTTEPEHSVGLYLNPTDPKTKTEQQTEPYITPTNYNSESQNTTPYIVPKWIVISTFVNIAFSLLVVIVCIIFGAVIAAMRNDINEINEKYDLLQESMKELQDEMSQSETSVLQGQIDELKASQTNSQSDLNKLEDKYDELSIDLTEVNATATGTEAAASQLRDELDEEKLKVSTLQTQITQVNQGLTSINGNLDGAETDIEALRTRVGCLEDNNPCPPPF